MRQIKGNIEKIVLNSLWQLEEADNRSISTLEIQRYMTKNFEFRAYTTIKTILDRLAKKGIIKSAKVGKKFYYGSTANRREIGLSELKNILKNYYLEDLESLKEDIETLQ